MHLTPQEWFIAGVAALWVYSAAVAALPTPTEKSSPFYVWIYGFLKIIAGDLTKTFGKYIPASTDASAQVAGQTTQTKQ